MADVIRLAALRDELTVDPETIGYTGDDDGDLALLMAVDRSVEKATLTSSEIFESIDREEYEALSPLQQEQVRVVLSLGDNIQISSGTKARAWLLDAFVALTATRAALQSVATKTVSRAEELGLGSVHLGDVQNARTI